MSFDEIVPIIRGLSAEDQIRLIDVLARQLLERTAAAPAVSPPSLFGALGHLGRAPTAEEIDEARREAWAQFPRGDH